MMSKQRSNSFMAAFTSLAIGTSSAGVLSAESKSNARFKHQPQPSRDDDESDHEPLDPSGGLQSFTATGRAYSPTSKAEKRQNNIASIGSADAWGAGPANTLPFKFTDESLIPVPCLRSPRKTDEGGLGPASEQVDVGKKKRWWRSGSKSGKSRDEDFVIRQIPRSEYLKHYARDEQGRFAGTEEPAADCMLNAEDLRTFEQSSGSRGSLGGEWRNEIPTGEREADRHRV